MTIFKQNFTNPKSNGDLKKLCEYYETTRLFQSTFDESVKELNLNIDPADRYSILFRLSHKYIMREMTDNDYHIITRAGMNNLELKALDLYSRIVFKMQAYSPSDNEEDEYIEFMGAKFKERNSYLESIANIPDYYVDYDTDPIEQICNKLEDQFKIYLSLTDKMYEDIKVITIKKNREVLFTVLIDE